MFEAVVWNRQFGVQTRVARPTGSEIHDFTGSIVVHAVGGWLAPPAVLLPGARRNRHRDDGQLSAHPPSNILFLARSARGS